MYTAIHIGERIDYVYVHPSLIFVVNLISTVGVDIVFTLVKNLPGDPLDSAVNGRQKSWRTLRDF